MNTYTYDFPLFSFLVADELNKLFQSPFLGGLPSEGIGRWFHSDSILTNMLTIVRGIKVPPKMSTDENASTPMQTSNTGTSTQTPLLVSAQNDDDSNENGN